MPPPGADDANVSVRRRRRRRSRTRATTTPQPFGLLSLSFLVGLTCDVVGAASLAAAAASASPSGLSYYKPAAPAWFRITRADAAPAAPEETELEEEDDEPAATPRPDGDGGGGREYGGRIPWRPPSGDAGNGGASFGTRFLDDSAVAIRFGFGGMDADDHGDDEDEYDDDYVRPYRLPTNVTSNSRQTALVLDSNPCLSAPCIHGVCRQSFRRPEGYECFCEDGYTGYECQTDWNECWNEPCLNGATCYDAIAYPNCSCTAGFTGAFCERRISECDSSPCMNNATCVDFGVGNFSCQCLPGYEGYRCEIDSSFCNESRTNNVTLCQNDGICIDMEGVDFACWCAPGWTGRFCEVDVDECESSPCMYGGMCHDMVADYYCVCPEMLTGKSCEFNMTLCQNKTCFNLGLCLYDPVFEEETCYCQPDFHTPDCSERYNECLLGHNCVNDGACLDDVDGYHCLCPEGFMGKYCECKIGFDPQCPSPILPTTVSLGNSTSALLTTSAFPVTESSTTVEVELTTFHQITTSSEPFTISRAEETTLSDLPTAKTTAVAVITSFEPSVPPITDKSGLGEDETTAFTTHHPPSTTEIDISNTSEFTTAAVETTTLEDSVTSTTRITPTTAVPTAGEGTSTADIAIEETEKSISTEPTITEGISSEVPTAIQGTTAEGPSSTPTTNEVPMRVTPSTEQSVGTTSEMAVSTLDSAGTKPTTEDSTGTTHETIEEMETDTEFKETETTEEIPSISTVQTGTTTSPEQEMNWTESKTMRSTTDSSREETTTALPTEVATYTTSTTESSTIMNSSTTASEPDTPSISSLPWTTTLGTSTSTVVETSSRRSTIIGTEEHTEGPLSTTVVPTTTTKISHLETTEMPTESAIEPEISTLTVITEQTETTSHHASDNSSTTEGAAEASTTSADLESTSVIDTSTNQPTTDLPSQASSIPVIYSSTTEVHLSTSSGITTVLPEASPTLESDKPTTDSISATLTLETTTSPRMISEGPIEVVFTTPDIASSSSAMTGESEASEGTTFKGETTEADITYTTMEGESQERGNHSTFAFTTADHEMTTITPTALSDHDGMTSSTPTTSDIAGTTTPSEHGMTHGITTKEKPDTTSARIETAGLSSTEAIDTTSLEATGDSSTPYEVTSRTTTSPESSTNYPSTITTETLPGSKAGEASTKQTEHKITETTTEGYNGTHSPAAETTVDSYTPEVTTGPQKEPEATETTEFASSPRPEMSSEKVEDVTTIDIQGETSPTSALTTEDRDTSSVTTALSTTQVGVSTMRTADSTATATETAPTVSKYHNATVPSVAFTDETSLFSSRMPMTTTAFTLVTSDMSITTLLAEITTSIASDGTTARTTPIMEKTPTQPSTSITHLKDATTSLATSSTVAYEFGCPNFPCQNGGTCIVEEQNQDPLRCECALGFIGTQCQHEVNATVPSFQPNSFLTFLLDDIATTPVVEMFLGVHVMSREGRILEAGDPDPFLHVSLQDGRILLEFSCGSNNIGMLKDSRDVFSTYVEIWIRLDLNVVGDHDMPQCKASLRVNETEPASSIQQPSKKRDQMLKTVVIGKGFVGCLSILQINNQEIVLSKEAVDGSGVGECGQEEGPDLSMRCPRNPCRNDGICVRLSFETWKCLCPKSFEGDLCERRRCSPENPCSKNASCLDPRDRSPFDHAFCVCHYGFSGPLCDKEMKPVTEPFFYGTLNGYSSYLAFLTPPELERRMQMRFHFATDNLKQRSILFYVGQQFPRRANPHFDFLAVGLRNGYLVILWNLGLGTSEVISPSPLDSHLALHTLKLTRIGNVAWIKVDTQPTVGGISPPFLADLNVHSLLYVGGHWSYNHSMLPEIIQSYRGFRGCILDLQLRPADQSVFLGPVRSLGGRNVGHCSRDGHEDKPCSFCLNGGICQSYGASIKCLCPLEYSGLQCEHRI